MLIVVERRETFHYYYPMGVHPPGDLTVTDQIQEAGNYKVYGASGQVGFLAEPGCKSDYLGIIKDGAGVGRISTYEASSYLLGTMAYIVPNLDVDINWLKYAVMSLNLSESISKTTIPHIYFSEYGNRKVSWCTIEEQRSIAVFLDCKCAEIDSVIAATQRTIEEYKKLKQSIITEAVTKGVRGKRTMKDSGSVWFGEIPAEWRMVRLKYMFHIKKDIAGKEGYTVLSITQRGITPKNIESNEGQLAADYSKYQLVEPGDFAMNHMDLLTGWVDISKYDGVTSPDYRVFVLDDDASNKEYYLYMMQMCYLNRIFYGLGQGVSGMGRWRLQADKFLNFYIAVPPAEEQDEIVEALKRQLSEMDALIAAKEQLLTEMESYKKSVIYEYVTGKKEVIQ